MTSDEIFNIIEVIANESSKIQKEEILREVMEDSMVFQEVLRLAYDPLKTFGVKPKLTAEIGLDNFRKSTWGLFNALMVRELTGHAALSAIEGELHGLTQRSQMLLLRILNKDLRADFGVKLINAARPNTVFEMPYMRCSLESEVDLDSLNWERGVFSQLKANGLFINISMMNGTMVMQSRQGQEFDVSKFQRIEGVMHENFKDNHQYHGEMLVCRGNQLLPRPIGNGILNKVFQGGSFMNDEWPQVNLWDCIPIYGPNNKPYSERFAMVNTLSHKYTSVKAIESKRVYSKAEAMEHFRLLANRGEEGIVLKDPDGIWKNGTSRQQIKLKREYECDLRIVGVRPGKGKNAATFGSLVCVSECGWLDAAVSGITDDLRLEIHKNLDQWLDKIITVKFKELTKAKNKVHYSLFEPRYLDVNHDRHEADSLKRIKKIVGGKLL